MTMFTESNTLGFTKTELATLNTALIDLTARGYDEGNASDLINNAWNMGMSAGDIVARVLDRTTTNHPNRSNYRYFKVCPRGFANEVTYYKVPADKVAECEALYRNYEDDGSGRYAGWSNDADARRPGVAIDWADRDS
jgi:hypothetical protein